MEFFISCRSKFNILYFALQSVCKAFPLDPPQISMDLLLPDPYLFRKTTILLVVKWANRPFHLYRIWWTIFQFWEG